jgi:hypothetical protein
MLVSSLSSSIDSRFSSSPLEIVMSPNPASSPARKLGWLLVPLTLVPLLGLAGGCKNPDQPGNTSSGSLVQKSQMKWPERVPRRVAVLPFEGNKDVTTQTTDLMSTELLKLGFDMIERSRLGTVINELKLSNSGLIDDATRRKLGSILGVEAVFIGTISGGEKFYQLKEHLNVKFIDVENGKVLWAADTSDTGIHMGPLNPPYVYDVHEAVRLLKQDLGFN